MKPILILVFSFFVANLASCDDDADNGADRGGPDSLIGFQWTADPLISNGIELEFGFRFDRDSVTANNTCNGLITATTTAPVKYRYSASIPSGDSKERSSGGATCFVEVVSGNFDFEIVGNQLHMTTPSEEQPIVFDSVGAVAGLYGQWEADAPGVGTVTWKMGGGKIKSTFKCDNGLSASITVNADFSNFFEIASSADGSVTEGGLTCEVSIAAGSIEYFFRGADLVMISSGQELVFYN